MGLLAARTNFLQTRVYIHIKRSSVCIAIHRKPHTVLRRLAVQLRTVFGDAPCLKPPVDGYKWHTVLLALKRKKPLICPLPRRVRQHPQRGRVGEGVSADNLQIDV